jgi:hypothetical protein
MDVTLCAPDEEKSCFSCCPPIRPAGYEHVTYRNYLKRELLENTRRQDAWGTDLRPITGFTCWALGYLDSGYKRVGCLLHPALHGGKDLRYRVGYEDKCSRETCPEAKTFLLLSPEERLFWLGLARGLDSFSYSSRGENPLFTLLGWGPFIFSLIASEEEGANLERVSFFEEYPFFKTDLLPKSNAYLLRRVVGHDRLRLLRNPLFRIEFERFSKGIAERFGSSAQEGTVSHRLDLEEDFRDFLRLHLHRAKIHPMEAGNLKSAVDGEIDDFRDSLASGN